MAVWLHYFRKSTGEFTGGILHLATHDRYPCGDARPIFTERQTRDGFALCGLPIEDEPENIYGPDDLDAYGDDPYIKALIEDPEGFICGTCRRIYADAPRSEVVS
jgi:hypothetical protein